jgi:hypothetical protein
MMVVRTSATATHPTWISKPGSQLCRGELPGQRFDRKGHHVAERQHPPRSGAHPAAKRPAPPAPPAGRSAHLAPPAARRSAPSRTPAAPASSPRKSAAPRQQQRRDEGQQVEPDPAWISGRRISASSTYHGISNSMKTTLPAISEAMASYRGGIGRSSTRFIQP